MAGNNAKNQNLDSVGNNGNKPTKTDYNKKDNNKNNNNNNKSNNNKSNNNSNNINKNNAKEKDRDKDKKEFVKKNLNKGKTPGTDNGAGGNDSPADNGAFQGALNSFLEFIKKYKRYIAALALFAVMAALLVYGRPKPDGVALEEPASEDSDDVATDEPQDADEEFQVNGIPEVNALIASYYESYAAGDVAALDAIARPMSDNEKSYIKLFSEYLDSYENISCYTKSGLADGEYVVSAYMEMKFKDVGTAAPGLDFFYVRTDDKGSLYIDNAYSQFNQSNMEESTEPDVQSLINDFEQEDDVVALQAEVQQKYDQAVESDEKLRDMASKTIPDAISSWVQSVAKEDADGEDSSGDDDASKDDASAGDDGGGDDAEGDSGDGSEGQDDDGEGDSAGEEGGDGSGSKKDDDGEPKTAYAMDGVNLRKGPDTDEGVITLIPLGGKMRIYPDTLKDGWVKARYDGHDGYVKREFVTTKRSKVPEPEPEEEDEPAPWLPEGEEVTLTDTINVRASMSETAERIGQAAPGDTVKVIMSYAEGWTKVEWNGQTGFMKTELIK